MMHTIAAEKAPTRFMSHPDLTANFSAMYIAQALTRSTVSMPIPQDSDTDCTIPPILQPDKIERVSLVTLRR